MRIFRSAAAAGLIAAIAYASWPATRHNALCQDKSSRTMMLIRLLLSLWIATQAAPAQSTQNTEQGSATLPAAVDEIEAEPLPGSSVEHERAMLESLYAAPDALLLWSEHERLSRQARELLEILKSSEAYGLRPSDYGVDRLLASATELSNDSPAVDWAQFDVRLSRAAIRLITHLHFGRIDPRAAGFELMQSRGEFNVASVVAGIASAPKVTDAVMAIEPRFFHYALLKTALAQYRALAADPSLTQLPSFGKRTLHAGEGYVGAPALRRLLTALGDLAPAATADATSDLTLDASLISGLKHFQDRHGLTADGSLGAQTYQALTTPLAQRVRQIELTLERWRWLPPFDAPPIIVNIPQFSLFAFRTTEDRDVNVLQMPVIVGQTYSRTRTPVFVGDLQYVIFRPYWDVPRSIVVHEMLPQIRADAGYLRRNHLELVDGQSDAGAVVAPTATTLAALAAGQLRLRQRPGDDNSLGLIKFVFPNTHNVYMHGTPAQRLFLLSRRAFSHGCIRVNDPVALARYVLRDTAGDWDDAKITAAMHASTSLRVELTESIRVMILYGTALATEAGATDFFDDIYGDDRKLETLLGLSPVSSAE
jgi:murein L,D-transpeptidase YcbB/YkuD